MGELRRGITLLKIRAGAEAPINGVNRRRAELERVTHEKVPSWFRDRILPVTIVSRSPPVAHVTNRTPLPAQR